MVSEAGVLAVQGDVREHAMAIRRAFGHDVVTREVRSPETVEDCDLLVLPGGESTTISRLVRERDLADSIHRHVARDRPVLATCAGLILVARDVRDDRVDPLGLLDIEIDRNAYGRQRESFEAPLDITGLDEPFPGVFIRAPRISAVGDVEVIATHAGEAVAVRQGPVIGASFHPELTDDNRFHALVTSAPMR